ncbi:hypothetical protein CH286_02655 [Rhodococcus sp. WWJCD1]|nr:hypothetical protein CH286_02655 [Rhodococcus sp. WWJCD1]
MLETAAATMAGLWALTSCSALSPVEPQPSAAPTRYDQQTIDFPACNPLSQALPTTGSNAQRSKYRRNPAAISETGAVNDPTLEHTVSVSPSIAAALRIWARARLLLLNIRVYFSVTIFHHSVLASSATITLY